MVDEFARRIAEIPMADEEHRLLLDLTRILKDKKATLDFEEEIGKRLSKLAELAKDVNVRYHYNLNILKSYNNKRRRCLNFCKLSMKVHGQLVRDLRNIVEECNDFKTFIGKTEEETCASYQTFNALTKFIREAQATMFELQQLTENLIMDNVKQELMHRKHTNARVRWFK